VKVVINTCVGGFGLSQAAYKRLIELGVPEGPHVRPKANLEAGCYDSEPRNEGIIFNTMGDDERYWGGYFITEDRSHPLLVQVVEELGAAASSASADLKVVEIPDGIAYSIEEHNDNGIEAVHEVHEGHRSWS